MGLSGETAASMVGGTLFTYPDNFRAQKAEIAAKYSGAKLTVSKDFKFGETNKSAAFLKKFPLGKVPAFEGTDGTLLTESNATTVVNQPNAKAVLGEVVLCSKEAQFDAKKFAEFSGKGDKKKEEKPKKEQPAKKEPEKKKEKPAAAAEEDDGMPKEPKSKDPLAALPKGTFDLEEWKRF